MSNIQLVPYIFFQGNCKAAMEFYQQVFGGKLTLLTYQDTMGNDAEVAEKDQINYAELVSDKIILKGMDSKIANPEARKVEIMVSGSKDDEEQLRKMFIALSAGGGKVKHKMEKQPRGNVQGRLFDAYGLDWVVSIEG